MEEQTTTMSMRDYSRLRAVTYEAVRQQVARYQKELEGHTFKENCSKKIMLDEFAIRFLDKHRMTRTVVVKASEDETQKELERLRQQVEQLNAELHLAKDEINEIRKSKEQLLIDNARNETLLALADKEHTLLEEAKKDLIISQRELEETKQEISRTKQELNTSTQELAKYHKSIFGFYRKDV
jgi:chromosome segregation ATPase